MIDIQERSRSWSARRCSRRIPPGYRAFTAGFETESMTPGSGPPSLSGSLTSHRKRATNSSPYVRSRGCSRPLWAHDRTVQWEGSRYLSSGPSQAALHADGDQKGLAALGGPPLRTTSGSRPHGDPSRRPRPMTPRPSRDWSRRHTARAGRTRRDPRGARADRKGSHPRKHARTPGGPSFENEDNLHDAIAHYKIAFDSSPFRGKAFDALIRIYGEQGNAKGIEGTFKAASVKDLSGSRMPCLTPARLRAQRRSTPRSWAALSPELSCPSSSDTNSHSRHPTTGPGCSRPSGSACSSQRTRPSWAH